MSDAASPVPMVTLWDRLARSLARAEREVRVLSHGRVLDWFELSRGLGAAAVLGRASNRRTVRSWPRSRKYVFRFTPCLLYDFDALALLESGLSVRRAMLAHACIYTYCYLHLSRHHLHSHSDTTTCLYALCLIPPIPCSLTTYITIVFVLVLAVVLFVVLS